MVALLSGILLNHFGAIVLVCLCAVALLLYWRGHAQGLFAFIQGMLSGPDGRPSTKNAGYFMGASVICWGFVKITQAVCERIRANTLDPTVIFCTLVGVLAGLTGTAYIWGKKIMAQTTGGGSDAQQSTSPGTPDPTSQGSES